MGDPGVVESSFPRSGRLRLWHLVAAVAVAAVDLALVRSVDWHALAAVAVLDGAVVGMALGFCILAKFGFPWARRARRRWPIDRPGQPSMVVAAVEAMFWVVMVYLALAFLVACVGVAVVLLLLLVFNVSLAM